MPRSILRISIWNFNLVFGPHALSKTFFFFVFFFRQVLVAFAFFSDRYFGHISDPPPKKGRLSVSWLVHDQHRSCKKITSEYMKMIGACPIHGSGSGLAGSARTSTMEKRLSPKVCWSRRWSFWAGNAKLHNNIPEKKCGQANYDVIWPKQHKKKGENGVKKLWILVFFGQVFFFLRNLREWVLFANPLLIVHFQVICIFGRNAYV